MKKIRLYLVLVCSLNLIYIGKSYAINNYTQTQYPHVFIHGFLGFDSLLGIIDYWPKLGEALREDGASVYIAETSTLNSSQMRGELLIEQIENFLAIHGAAKVNLWGHSQGSLDARYVASVRPDLVASITSIAGTHNTDIQYLLDNDAFVEPTANLIRFTAGLIQLLSLNSHAFKFTNAQATLSYQGITEINALYPIGLPTSTCGEGLAVETIAGEDIYIFSWGGISTWTTFIDPTDVLMHIAASYYPQHLKTDGVVSRCATHLGDVIRDDYQLNHIDMVNLMFGLVPPFAENPVSTFRTHANRLKNLGL